MLWPYRFGPSERALLDAGPPQACPMPNEPHENARPSEPDDPRPDDDKAADQEPDPREPDDDNAADQEPDDGEPEPPNSDRSSDAPSSKPRSAPLPRVFLLFVGLGLPAALLAANMWHVHEFTVDDSYISYRYAKNLIRGLGLVYNAGERIEGYTNFLWTLMIAGALRLGLDPDVFTKVVGALASFGSLGLTYVISSRLRPFHWLPCVATWLLASTIVFTGYAVFGLETPLFTFLLLAGTLLFLREDAAITSPNPRASAAFPFSGIVFALAGLTRPEAPMFIGILMLFLGRRFFSRQNLLRGALFAIPIAAHLLWRHSYYGSWVPNTLAAKTGNFDAQIHKGWDYVQTYIAHAGPVLYLGIFGVAIGLARRRRDILAIAGLTVASFAYIVLIGGDWMYYWRFMAPFEPFAFLLVDVAARDIVDRKSMTANLALAAFAIVVFAHRAGSLRGAQRFILTDQLPFWTTAEGGTAKWLLSQNDPGEVALGDIGYIGYTTDYPILDLLGLVDPVISHLPGTYTYKVGPGFTDRLFNKAPKYVLIISATLTCDQPSTIGSQIILRDPRFKAGYAVSGKVPVGKGFAWCLFKRKPEAAEPSPTVNPSSSP